MEDTDAVLADFRDGAGDVGGDEVGAFGLSGESEGFLAPGHCGRN